MDLNLSEPAHIQTNHATKSNISGDWNLTNITTSSSPSPDRFISNATVRIIYIGLDIFNSFFQLLCSCLLIIIYRRSLRKTPQRLFLVNLSVCEAVICLYLTARDVCNLMRLYDGGAVNDTIDYAFWSMNIFFVTALSYGCILSMVYITGDRLLHTLLTVRYQVRTYFSSVLYAYYMS